MSFNAYFTPIGWTADFWRIFKDLTLDDPVTLENEVKVSDFDRTPLRAPRGIFAPNLVEIGPIWKFRDIWWRHNDVISGDIAYSRLSALGGPKRHRIASKTANFLRRFYRKWIETEFDDVISSAILDGRSQAVKVPEVRQMSMG